MIYYRKPWQQTLLTRSVSLIPALTVALISSNSFDDVDELLNVQQSVQLPFALLPLLFMNCNPRVMGIFSLNYKWKIFFYASSALVVGINVYIIYYTIVGLNMDSYMKIIIISVGIVFYMACCLWLIIDFILQQFKQNDLDFMQTKSNSSVVGLLDEDDNNNNQVN